MTPGRPDEAMSEIVILRAHHLLCAPGFRGLGYSKAFAENFSAVLQGLRQRPEAMVDVIDQPDMLCGVCPHLKESRCQREGPEEETKVKGADQKVLARMGLPAGTRLSWEEWLRRVGSSIGPEDLPTLCGPCPWLTLKHCTMGLARLREGS